MDGCEPGAAGTRQVERGQRIRQWRQENRWSQEALAQAIGISTSALREWENGRTNNIVTGRRRLLEITGWSDEYLEYGITGRPPVDQPNPPLEAACVCNLTHEQHLANVALVESEPTLVLSMHRGTLSIYDIADIANYVRQVRSEQDNEN